MFRRRPVAKIAAVGAVAHTAAKAGANAATADAAQTAPTEQPPAEQATPVAAAPAAEDSMEELTKLKGLLDSGVLTQAEFDAQKPIRLVGTITRVQWTNPHSFFYIDVKDESGNVVNWACEGGGPGALSRRAPSTNTSAT